MQRMVAWVEKHNKRRDEFLAATYLMMSFLTTCMKPFALIHLSLSFSDLSALAADLPTLLGVTTGIAVLAGLICMVLHLFSKTKYPRTRHFADAHAGPPIMFASDTGMSLSLVTF